MILGERIKRARKLAVLSQTALAKRIGVTKSAVSQWESGDSKGLKPENLIAVARTLAVNVEWLVTGRGDMLPSPIHPLLVAFDKMPPSGKAEFLGYAGYIIDRLGDKKLSRELKALAESYIPGIVPQGQE